MRFLTVRLPLWPAEFSEAGVAVLAGGMTVALAGVLVSLAGAPVLGSNPHFAQSRPSMLPGSERKSSPQRPQWNHDWLESLTIGVRVESTPGGGVGR